VLRKLGPEGQKVRNTPSSPEQFPPSMLPLAHPDLFEARIERKSSLDFMPGRVMSCACLVATIDTSENQTVCFTVGLTMRRKASSPVWIAIEDFSCGQSVISKLKLVSIIRECIFLHETYSSTASIVASLPKYPCWRVSSQPWARQES
jgi:hypothetical protein